MAHIVENFFFVKNDPQMCPELSDYIWKKYFRKYQ